MKKTSILLIFTVVALLGFKKAIQSQSAFMFEGSEEKAPLRTVKNEAFQKGEVLKYKVRYGFIEAGEAILEVKEETKTLGPRKAYHIIGTGNSKGTFDWFFKVRDRYETYIDEQAIVPWVFIRRVYEGGFIIHEDYTFNHYKNKVDVGEGKVVDVPEHTQDMLSAFYAARCLDFSAAKTGDIFVINSVVDKELFPLKMKYIGKETIKTNLGKFRCLKFRPVVQSGRVFKKEEDLNVWITDDKNHIPIRAQADVLVGSIKMDLSHYSGLASPISKVE